MHLFLIGHEPHLALIGDRGDQIDALPFGRKADRRRLAARRIRAAMLAVIAQPGLIPPMDLGTFLLGPFGNRRILFIEPALNGLRVLLIGALQRLLRRANPKRLR